MSWSERQQTIAREVTCDGKGIHTGEPARMTLKPAPVDHGIRFTRPGGTPEFTLQDIDPNGAPGRTALSRDGDSIQTIEHLMAALMGLGVDNVQVELAGPEAPALDGSALGFAELIESVGLQQQDAAGTELVIERPVHLQDGDASLIALPYTGGYRVTYTLHYHGNPLAQGHGTFDVDPSTFRSEIAPCRTFCMKAEVEQARKMGLGKGAGYENTLVIDGETVEGNTLRFGDEPLRHKILDMIGDLGLLGAPLRGHLIGVCSGHALNRQMVERLREATRVAERQPAPVPLSPSEDVEKLIPHRYPFLFIDRVVSREPGKRLVAVKGVTRNEPFFQGHFPGRPLMPGVLIVESLLQAAAALMPAPDNSPHTLAQIEKFRVRRPVLPGDQLELEVELMSTRGRWARVRGTARVGGQVAGEGTFLCVKMDLDRVMRE